MTIVGFFMNGKAIPFELPVDKSPEAGDIVLEGGMHYRIFFDGNKKRFSLVQAEWNDAVESYGLGGSASDVMGRGW